MIFRLEALFYGSLGLTLADISRWEVAFGMKDADKTQKLKKYAFVARAKSGVFGLISIINR